MSGVSVNVFACLQSAVLFGITWSIGAGVDVDGRQKFDTYFRDLLSGKFEEYPVPKAMGKIEAPIPPDHLIYDYMYEVSS